MERTVPTPAARLESGTPFRVWYGIAAAPTTWVLLSAVDWWVTGRTCGDGDASWGPLSPAAVRALLLGAAAAAMAVGATALSGSRRAWRELSPRQSLNQAYAYGTAEYLAIAGVVISAVFLIAMTWTALPAIMIDVCEAMR